LTWKNISLSIDILLATKSQAVWIAKFLIVFPNADEIYCLLLMEHAAM
jgi:hypothetical protein